MKELTLELETTKLERYLIKHDRADFIKETRGASPETLDAKLLGLAKHNQEISNTKADDEELIQAAQRKKDLEAPYREQLRMNTKLARFVSLIMQEQGLK